ncbi:uncharacterized protein LOC132716726 [Ruditapes philippinarum]|uniref:uncharacterized protein LOC132716726 n=1 Tax=Ruditapes philippinarum TaxID=129788 RepID=UPI00295BB55F|nr:uncharacterized protein LOC132716726 [Ruditapes philippinarum]
MIVLTGLHVKEAEQTVAKLEQIKSDTFNVNTHTISEVLSELILTSTKEDEVKAMQIGKSKKRKPTDRLNELHEYNEIFSRANIIINICELETIISNQGETFYGPNKSAKKFKMAGDEFTMLLLVPCHREYLYSGERYKEHHGPLVTFSDQEVSDWEHCLSTDTTSARKIAEFHIKNQNFPEQQVLNKLFQRYGRKDELITTLCNKLGTFIKEKSKKIVQVIPSYFKDSDLCEKIIFVICTKEDLSEKEEETIKKYPHKIRPVGEYSLEGKTVTQRQLETKENLSFQDLQKLKKCINKHADTLFSKHKMLSIIAPSPVRSKLYGSENADIIPELCIVFYVHTKKYIPIEEEPFDNFYDEIPVDVREGSFMTHPANPVNHETLSNLKMGCNIGSEQSNYTGTLGGFIDHPTYGLCGLTCAHVLLDDEFMDDLLRIGSIIWPNFHPNESVTQPGGTTNVMGRLVQADYKKGEDDQSGLEIALFQVERRHPHTGTFLGHDDMRFNSGKSYGLSRINDAPVVKIGSTTHETVGIFKMSSPAVSVRPLSIIDARSLKFTLHNQLEVCPLTDRYAFSERGDSGSLVFMKRSDEDNEYICVGMVEGGTDYGTTIVTPITSILQACGVDSFKSFETANLSEDLKNVETRITNTMDQKFSEVMDKLNERGNNVT